MLSGKSRQVITPDFLNELYSIPGGEGVRACIQCGICSGSCPNVALMDNSPRKTIALLRNGLYERVLSSNTMWVCLSCYQCTVRCPRGVKPTDLMHVLEGLAVRYGLANKKTTTPIMYAAFVDSVKDYGRVHEFGLMVNYLTKSLIKEKNPQAALRMLPVGLKLLLRGRLTFRPRKIKGAGEIKKLVSMTRKLEGAV